MQNTFLPVMPAVQRRVFYSGRVQGVGFRWTVRQLATGFEVAGWVRNCPDGRVELLASGEPGEVEQFLQAIPQSTLGAHIRGVEEQAAEPSEGRQTGFTIRH